MEIIECIHECKYMFMYFKLFFLFKNIFVLGEGTGELWWMWLGYIAYIHETVKEWIFKILQKQKIFVRCFILNPANFIYVYISTM